MARRPNHRGRVTPKRNAPARPRERDDAAPPPMVGRRPSNPGFLLALGIVWIVCGMVALVTLSAGWKLIPAIVFVGIGGLYIRAAATTVVRRSR